MPFSSLRAPVSVEIRKPRTRFSPFVPLFAMFSLLLTLAAFAQTYQPPQRVPKGVLVPEANRLPDANDQMEMREKYKLAHNYAAANAERRKQLEQASEMLETMAMSLKAEVDKSGDLSQNTVHKAETIEMLAHIVKERMKLTVAPD